MDDFLLHGSDQQIPTRKSHIGKPPPQHSFISSPYNYHNFNQSMGILQTPPPFLTHSYSLPRLPPPQPPLLPLPVAVHRHHSSSTPCSRRTRDQPNNSKSTKKEGKGTPKKPSSGALTVTLTKPSTPNPNGPPRNINAKVSPGWKGITAGNKTIGENQVDFFPGSNMVFTMSPPPSSLPLPSFCLRHSKLSCNAQAGDGSVDTDASDDLRRLLQLSKRA